MRKQLALGSEKRYTAAIPRERGGKSCQDICSSVTDMDEETEYPGTYVIKVEQNLYKMHV